MRKLILVLLSVLLFSSLHAKTFLVVKHKATGKIVYRSQPNFLKGYGIKNAIVLKGGKASDYREVYVSTTQWTKGSVK